MVSEAGTPTAGARARKAKNLLASYYATDAEPEASPLGDNHAGSFNESLHASPESPSHAPARPPPEQDPAIRLRELLGDLHLPELISQERELATEVSALNSDMQQLVYENYNKFITATDTIRAMSTSMAGMDSDMERLKGLLATVTRQSDAVCSSLERRQSQVEELNRTRNLLHRLRAVFNLPRRLRELAAADEIEEAVARYEEVLPLLRTHGDKGAFKRVAQETATCAREIADICVLRLGERPAEATDHLRRLGEPEERLQELVLGQAAEEMRETLADVEGQWGGGARSPVPDADFLKRHLVDLDSRLLTQLVQATALYGELFPSAPRQPLVDSLRPVFQRYWRHAKKVIGDSSAALAACAAGISLRGGSIKLVAAGEGRGGAGIVVRVEAAREAALGSLDSDWGASVVLQAVQVVRTDTSRLEGALRELRPRDRGTELVEGTIREHVRLSFAALARRVLGELDAVYTRLTELGPPTGDAARETGPFVGAAAAATETLLCEGLVSILRSLRTYEASPWALEGWFDEFASLCEGQLRSFCLTTARLAASRASGGRDEDGEPGGTAAALEDSLGVGLAVPFARLADASTGGAGGAPPPVSWLVLWKAWSGLRERLPTDLMPGGSSVGDGDRLAAELRELIGTSATAALRAYVRAHSRRLALAARSVTESTDWATAREPRRPREFCHLLLESMSLLEGEVVAVAGEGEPEASDATHALSSRVASSAQGTNALQTGAFGLDATALNRMFMRRAKFQEGDVDSSSAGVRASVLVATLHALVDALRGQRLSRAAFQQVQLDVHYLRPRLAAAVSGALDEAAALQALEEVVAVAMDGCAEPVLLEDSVLDRILAAL